MRISTIACVILIGALAPAAEACEDLPFWKNTLRCNFFPTETPPSLPAEPEESADVKDFTLVPLPSRNARGEILRCVDGTRPAIYVDEAEGDEDANKNNWVVTFQGGGSCNDASSCVADYLNPSETAEMVSSKTC